MSYIIIPPQGYYQDFAEVAAVATTKEEAIAAAEKEGGVAYRASGYAVGASVPRSAIDQMRLAGQLVERAAQPARPSMIARMRENSRRSGQPE